MNLKSIWLAAPLVFVAIFLTLTTPTAYPQAVDDLMAQGDKLFKGGQFSEALKSFQLASGKAPDDIRILYRIIIASTKAKEPKAGLAALEKLLKLKPELASDAELKQQKVLLEGIGEEAFELDENLKLAIDTAESLLKDARTSTDAEYQKHLLEQAREKMAPWFTHFLTAQPHDCYVWRTTGLIAIAQGDSDLAAFTFDAIQKLRQYMTNTWAPETLSVAYAANKLDALKLELNRLPIESKLADIQKGKWKSSRALSANLNTDTESAMFAAKECLIGAERPRWLRGGLEVIQRVSELPDLPQRGSEAWKKMLSVKDPGPVNGNDEKDLVDRESDYLSARAEAKEMLAYFKVFGLFENTRNREEALALLYKYARCRLPLDVELYHKDPSEDWRPSTYHILGHAAQKIGVSFLNGRVLGLSFIPITNKTIKPDRHEASYWAGIALESWTTYQKNDYPNFRPNGWYGEAIHDICAKLNNEAGGEEEETDTKLALDLAKRWQKLYRGAKGPTAPTKEDQEQLTEFNALITSALFNLGLINAEKKNYSDARTYYEEAAEMDSPEAMNNLGNLWWDGDGGSRNKSKAILWWQKAARRGNEKAKNNLQGKGQSW